MRSRSSLSSCRAVVIAGLSGALLVLGGCSRHPFSGAFVADNRPAGMVFLSTTQTGSAVSGFLVNVVPDGRGGTTSQTVAVDGSADSDTVTLRAKAVLGLINVTLSGRADGRRLVLSSSSSSGRIESLTFSRSTQESFNARLTEWQASLSAQHEQEEAARITAESRARAEREEAAAREALTQRAQGSGIAFIASIHRLADAASALDRVTFEGEEHRYAQWWASMQRHAVHLHENASGGTAQCWVLRNELGFEKNDMDVVKQLGRSLAARETQLDDLVARVERDVAESERLEEVFSNAARADATGAIPSATVGEVREKAKSSRAVVTQAIARARTRKATALESAAGHERNGDAFFAESQRIVTSASCRGR